MALMGKDKSCINYIDFFKDFTLTSEKASSAVKAEEGDEKPLIRAIVKGLKEPSYSEAKKALEAKSNTVRQKLNAALTEAEMDLLKELQ